jgi:signal transduction histidine kinase
VITAPLCTIICLIYIGWPLKRLIGGMTRIKDGNFSPLPLKNQQDEIGVLLAAFNVMATELDNTRRQLKEEAQSRRHVQAALQEADKLITIGQLSAGLAHEIGSPLQVLKGRAEHLLLCAGQPEKVIRNAQILASQAERITRIVQQILEFTRRRPPHFTRIDLREPVNAVLNLLEYEAHKKQVELSFEAAKDLPLIHADSDGIQQIVLNLVSNALAATGARGRIVVGVKPALIPLTARLLKRYNSLSGTTAVVCPKKYWNTCLSRFLLRVMNKAGSGLGSPWRAALSRHIMAASKPKARPV